MCNKIKTIMPLGMMIFCFDSLFGQWETDVRLTYNDSISITNWNSAWCIAANGDTVLIVWYDGRDGNIVMSMLYGKTGDRETLRFTINTQRMVV